MEINKFNNHRWKYKIFILIRHNRMFKCRYGLFEYSSDIFMVAMLRDQLLMYAGWY